MGHDANTVLLLDVIRELNECDGHITPKQTADMIGKLAHAIFHINEQLLATLPLEQDEDHYLG